MNQTSLIQAACPPDSQFDWMRNQEMGQDPCTVATFLLRPCFNNPNLALVPQLNQDQHYTNPGGFNCSCNTVQYTLLDACALCQGAQPTTWSYWSTNCTINLPLTEYPNSVPDGTTIPSWAKRNVSITDRANLTDPEGTPEPSSTSIVFFPPTSSTTASPEPSHSESSAPGLTSAATLASDPPVATVTITASAGSFNAQTSVIAGVVGGVGGLAVLVAAGFGVLWYYRRMRGGRTPVSTESGGMALSSEIRDSHQKRTPVEFVPGRSASGQYQSYRAWQ